MDQRQGFFAQAAQPQPQRGIPAQQVPLEQQLPKQLRGDEEQTSRVIKKLAFYSFLILTVPIFMYFYSKNRFQEYLGWPEDQSNIYAAIVAATVIHVILAAFVYSAYMEGARPQAPGKRD